MFDQIRPRILIILIFIICSCGIIKYYFNHNYNTYGGLTNAWGSVVKNYHRYGYVELSGAPVKHSGKLNFDEMEIWTSSFPLLNLIIYSSTLLQGKDINSLDIFSIRISGLIFWIINLTLLFLIVSKVLTEKMALLIVVITGLLPSEIYHLDVFTIHRTFMLLTFLFYIEYIELYKSNIKSYLFFGSLFLSLLISPYNWFIIFSIIIHNFILNNYFDLKINSKIIVTSALAFLVLLLIILQYPNLTGLGYAQRHLLERIYSGNIQIFDYFFQILPNNIFYNSVTPIFICSIIGTLYFLYNNPLNKKAKSMLIFFFSYGILPGFIFIQGSIKHTYLISDFSIFMVTISVLFINQILAYLSKKNTTYSNIILLIFLTLSFYFSSKEILYTYNNSSEHPLEYPLAISIKENTLFGEEVLTDLNIRQWVHPLYSETRIVKNVDTINKLNGYLINDQYNSYKYFYTTTKEYITECDYFNKKGDIDDPYYRISNKKSDLILYLIKYYEYKIDNGFLIFKLQ